MSEKLNVEKLINGLSKQLPEYIRQRDDYNQLYATVETIDTLISKGYIREDALFDLVESNRKIRVSLEESLKKLNVEIENLSAVLKGETPKSVAKPTEPETDGTLLEWMEKK